MYVWFYVKVVSPFFGLTTASKNILKENNFNFYQVLQSYIRFNFDLKSNYEDILFLEQ